MSESQGADAGSPPAGNTSDDAGSQGTSSAGTQNTGAQGGGTMIPKARFDEVNNRAKSAEGALEQLREEFREAEERIAVLEERPAGGGKPNPTNKEAALPDPPPGLSQLEQVRWYVNKTVEAETGMSLKELKDAASGAREHQNSLAVREWTEAATTAGLDPNDKKHAAAVTIAIKSNEFDSLEDACAFTAKSLGLSKEGSAGADDVPEMEVGGEGTSQFTVADVVAKNARDANELARKGKRVRHRSVEDVFANRQKKG